MRKRLALAIGLYLVAGGGLAQHSEKPHADGKLFLSSEQRVFTSRALQAIAFPLGGIGTGTISVGGRGDLRDWEIFNHPGKGKDLPYSFFALWTEVKGGGSVTKVLERELFPPYSSGGFGSPADQVSGLPRLREARFRGEYPFAWIDFQDPDLPVQVSLEAWNPLVPLNATDSGIPAILLTWRLINLSGKPVRYALASTLFNPIGTDGYDFGSSRLGQNLNEFVDAGTFRGLRLSSRRLEPEDPAYGTMALATTWRSVTAQTHWYRGGWWDGVHLFWDDFSADGDIAPVTEAKPSPQGKSDVGVLVLKGSLEPGESVALPLILAWHFPTRVNTWNWQPEVKGKPVRNWYATQWRDAWDVVSYVVENLPRLEQQTRRFHDALFGSTLPWYVLEAVSSQLSTLRTNTCWRAEDGTFFAFEGCSNTSGCCPMNCTHVWNYEQTLAFLFPDLERSMREVDFLHNLREDGSMAFRTLVPLGPYLWDLKPAADGQMGTILKAYREWKLSGNTDWLRKIWPGVVKALEYAWTAENAWDADRDGVMEGEQHNTFDIEFYGPNPMTGTLYLAALRAASGMAAALGDARRAREYEALARKGGERLDKLLWNGQYYEQKVTVSADAELPEHLRTPGQEDFPKYQIGSGCLSDQLQGEWWARVVGLSGVLPEAHVREALKSVFAFNWQRELRNYPNVERVFGLNDEPGLLNCTWPRGGKPKLPLVYASEVWTGVEYEVAALMLYEGLVREGLSIVRGVAERYDGLRRNPWDQEECGHHYARALSSWSLLLALSGYQVDAVKSRMAFAPVLRQNRFRCFWSSAEAWGTYEQRPGQGTAELRVLWGEQRLRSLALGWQKSVPKRVNVSVNGEVVPARVSSTAGGFVLDFPEEVRIPEGEALLVELEF